MLQRILYSVLFLLCGGCIVAQTCGTSYVPINRIKNTIEQRTDEVLYVPVVVHYVYPQGQEFPTEEYTAIQIEAINRNYNRHNNEWKGLPYELRTLATSANIQFYLANVDPNGNDHVGITYTYTHVNEIGNFTKVYHSSLGGKDAWPTDRYLNIWVCETNPNLLGHATTPYQPISNQDGVVINYPYFGVNDGVESYGLGRTVVHEIGHYLGLAHTWGNIANECIEDDGIDDTPAQSGPIYDCEVTDQESCTDALAFGNFMDYSPDCCLSYFTPDQVAVMRGILLGTRSSLLGQEETPSVQLSQYNVVPNPVNTFCTITWPATSKVEEVSIQTVGGQPLFVYHNLDQSNQLEICLEDYPFGVLLAVIKTKDKKMEVVKIVHI